VALEEFSGRVADWVANGPVAAEVQRRFRRFLRTFTDERGQRVYMQRIEQMVLGAFGWFCFFVVCLCFEGFDCPCQQTPGVLTIHNKPIKTQPSTHQHHQTLNH
jgi:hypothetical protein